MRSYRRYPPPVPPKPKYRIRVEVSACNGVPDAEPAVKTRRVERVDARGKLTYPLTCLPLSPYSTSNPLTSTTNHNRGDGNGDEISSCCDWQNAPVAAENSCKLHAIETNNNNYNCKLETTSNGALQSNKTNRACILRYDRYGHLKQEFTLNRNSKTKRNRYRNPNRNRFQNERKRK